MARERVRIVFCQSCGYFPQARELTQELEKSHPGVEVEVEDGDRGIFDVYFGDELVFSRYKEMRFPEPGEVSRAIAVGKELEESP
jgi:selT/selW/selH-like putative selenoprotein